MRIEQAFPRILRRQYPVVKGRYPLLTVLYLLRMKDIDAVPILPFARRGARAVFGFSCLPQFLSLGQKEFADYLKGPCEAASSELATVSVKDDLGALLRSFESRRLGVALAHDGGKQMEAGLVSLVDVLDLYSRGAIRAAMRAEDVGSKIFHMPGTTSMREALRAMFRHRVRRVFLTGEFNYVSERSIMGYLFSPMTLEDLGYGDGKDPLSTPIARAEKNPATMVDPKISLKAAAAKLIASRGGCLATSAGKVITPWDVVIKPWQAGRLTIKDGA